MARTTAVFLLGLAAALQASAAVESAEPVDATDLWQAADGQPGWGVNVSQQGDTMFVTVLVHGKNSQPTWFVAPSTKLEATGGASTFSGPLYSTGGSPYLKRWDRGDYSYRQVGTVSFSMTSPTTATLTYTADGVQVTKDLARQTVALNNLNGQYIGAVAGTFSACANPESNGFTTEYATISIVQGRTTTMTLENWRGAGSCTYTGTYSQVGRIGAMRGRYACSGGNSGTFAASAIERTTTGITMKLQEVSSFCRYTGRVGGVKATP